MLFFPSVFGLQSIHLKGLVLKNPRHELPGVLLLDPEHYGLSLHKKVF
jgi:hypothetical protein